VKDVLDSARQVIGKATHVVLLLNTLKIINGGARIICRWMRNERLI